MVLDMHVHTRFSCDSKEEMNSYCETAIQNAIQTICFTDHVDYNEADSGYHYYDADSFFREFNEMKEKYGGKLELLSGLEFSEPHLYQDKLNEYKRYPYDFIIGSIHYWYQDMFPSQMIKHQVPLEICYISYWEAVHAAVKAGGFHCLGHMDFPKRYYGKLLFEKTKIEHICSDLLKNNICIEINTSSLRRGLQESLPDKDILEIYRMCGGKDVTIGSDAHNVDELAADNLYAEKLIRYYGFTEVFFCKGERSIVSSI